MVPASSGHGSIQLSTSRFDIGQVATLPRGAITPCSRGKLLGDNHFRLVRLDGVYNSPGGDKSFPTGSYLCGQCDLISPGNL